MIYVSLSIYIFSVYISIFVFIVVVGFTQSFILLMVLIQEPDCSQIIGLLKYEFHQPTHFRPEFIPSGTSDCSPALTTK